MILDFRLVMALVVVVCSLIGFVVCFAAELHRWARIACAVACVSGVGKCVLMSVRLRYSRPNHHPAIFLRHYEAVFAWVFFGIVLCLFLSAQVSVLLRAAKKRCDPNAA